VLALALTASTQTFAATFNQGFETDVSGWFTPTRVPSGTNGITSAAGSYHAETAQNAGNFTRWGGYDSSTGGVPGAFQPYTTSIDIFLNVSSGAANDTRFDFSSAINKPDGTHLRDFVFNAGFYDSADVTGPGAGSNRFVISAGNNANRDSSFPKNTGAVSIASSGWYTFEQEFFNNGGNLGVTMNILDSTDLLIATWLLGGSDLIGNVGGNRYGWFVNNEFSFLAIDNTSLTSSLSSVPLPAALPLFATGLGVLGLLGWRRKRRVAVAA
jgi:hypothetical protein